MTTKRLEQINRRTRIIAAIRAGYPPLEIAVVEHVTCSYVRHIARHIDQGDEGGFAWLSKCDWAGVMRLAERVPTNESSPITHDLYQAC